MNIISTQYTLKYKSFEIVVSGCKGRNGHHCKGCHSPETWSFDVGTDYKEHISGILKKVKDADDLISWIWLYGGEPLDNNLDDLIDLLEQLKETGKPIMLFTSHDFDTVPKDVMRLCSYIKCGEYDETLRCEDNIQYGVKLATSNQKIYKRNLNGTWN